MKKKKLIGSNRPMLTVENAKEPGVKPACIFSGVKTALKVTLVNTTDDDIALRSGTNASRLEIYLPAYFTHSELQVMTIVNISMNGWEFAYNGSSRSLELQWSGEEDAWLQDTAIYFTITEVLTLANQGSDDIQVSLVNLKGKKVPAQTTTKLILKTPPLVRNASLRDVLNVSANYGGTIYVSEPLSPVKNTVSINIRHESKDGTPLYSGVGLKKGNPKVFVSFEYGSTSGSLAPAEKSGSTQVGSAWQVSGNIRLDQGNKWTVQNPRASDSSHTPVWTLSPALENKDIIGTGNRSTITVEFTNIVSFTPRGVTLAYIHFTGFMHDDTTAYDDEVFVVPIEKAIPPNPGVKQVWSNVDKISVRSGKDRITLPLTWAMFASSFVKLSFTFRNIKFPDRFFSYPLAHDALHFDTQAIQWTDEEWARMKIPMAGMLIIRCETHADDSYTKILSKAECSLYIEFKPVINSFTVELDKTQGENSYAFRLKWDIDGAEKFEITARDPYTVPVVDKVLPIPNDVNTYVVSQQSLQTTYTLKIYGP